ncbi:hypothetical protein CRG98_026137, partial [Punica granatum]
GYKGIMENCMENARVLKEGIEQTGKFEVLLRRFGWIVPAYTMPADAQHIAVLRVVVREDFNRSLAMRLVSNIEKVLGELEARASRISVIAATVTKVAGEEKQVVKKTVEQIQEEAHLDCTGGTCHVPGGVRSNLRTVKSTRVFPFR